MTSELLLLGAVGGALTDVLRTARLARMSQLPKQGEWAPVVVSVVLNAAIGAFAGWLAESATRVAALATGFGAPEFLMRLLGPVSKAPAAGEPGPGGQASRRDRYFTV